MKLTRKKSEIEERIAALLDIAEKLIAENSFNNFKLEDLTEPSGFSRGTIYLTFKSKENLVAKLAIRTLDKWQELVERAINYRGGTREKILAFLISQIILIHLYPSGLNSIQFCELYINQSNIDDVLHDTIKQKCEKIIYQIELLIEEAIIKKELSLPTYISSSQFATNLWTSHHGAIAFTRADKYNQESNAMHHLKFIRLLLDCLPWQPISDKNEQDDAAILIIFSKLFPTEFNIIYP